MGFKQAFLIVLLILSSATYAGNLSSSPQTPPQFDVRPAPQQWTHCRYELARHGYPAQKQNDFCRLPSANQWTCAQLVLKKYHSLELAKETCLNPRASEVNCYTQVMNRNFDPYVAKRVCKIN